MNFIKTWGSVFILSTKPVSRHCSRESMNFFHFCWRPQYNAGLVQFTHPYRRLKSNSKWHDTARNVPTGWIEVDSVWMQIASKYGVNIWKMLRHQHNYYFTTSGHTQLPSKIWASVYSRPDCYVDIVYFTQYWCPYFCLVLSHFPLPSWVCASTFSQDECANNRGVQDTRTKGYVNTD